MPRLCSFGCAPSGVPMHRFPNLNKVPELFKLWVSLVGGKLDSASDYEYYKKKRICDIHFSEKDKNRNNRLNAEAIPTLNLPAQSQTATTSHPIVTGPSECPSVVLKQEPCNSNESRPQATSTNSKHTSFLNVIITEQIEHVQLSTAQSQTATTSHPIVTGPSECPSVVVKQEPCNSNESRPQATSTNSKHTSSQAPKEAKSTLKQHAFLDHNYAITSKPTKGIVKSRPTYNLEQPMYSKMKRLRSEILRLRKKNQSFKARLRSAKFVLRVLISKMLQRT